MERWRKYASSLREEAEPKVVSVTQKSKNEDILENDSVEEVAMARIEFDRDLVGVDYDRSWWVAGISLAGMAAALAMLGAALLLKSALKKMDRKRRYTKAPKVGPQGLDEGPASRPTNCMMLARPPDDNFEIRSAGFSWPGWPSPPPSPLPPVVATFNEYATS